MKKNENGEMITMTVQEATEVLLMSQSSVYSWIERGKLPTEDLPSGKVIVISKNEAEKIKEYNLKSRRNRVSKYSQQNSGNLSENSVIDAEITENCEENFTIHSETQPGSQQIGQLPQDTLKLVELISSLSAKAGKYELLADLQKQRENDLEYWKNMYFQLQSEYNSLKTEYEKLKSRSIFGFLLSKDK